MLWKYNPKNLTVSFNVQPGYDYEVDLGRCKTASQILGWYMHLSEKNWATPTALHDFLITLDRLLNLRNHQDEKRMVSHD